MGQASYKTIGPWIDADTVKDLGADTLKELISNGTSGMPTFKYDLDAQRINDVIEFLKAGAAHSKAYPGAIGGKISCRRRLRIVEYASEAMGRVYEKMSVSRFFWH